MAFEGYGAGTVGGVGGTTIHVTTLDDSGPGSLRAALTASGARNIVFDVTGTITVLSPLYIDEPFCTIDGSTAPGSGITIQNPRTSPSGLGLNSETFSSIFVRTNEVIISHLAVRPGVFPPIVGEQYPLGDVFSIFIENAENVVVDHCSLSDAWARMISIDSSSNITVSWCIISHGLPADESRTGDPWAGKATAVFNSSNVSFHHNLFAHASARMPHVNGLGMDVRYNVLYDWYEHGGDLFNMYGDAEINFIGNTIIPLTKATSGVNAHDNTEYDYSVLYPPPNTPIPGTFRLYIDNPSQLQYNSVLKWNGTTLEYDLITFIGSEYQALAPFAAPVVTQGASIYPTVGRFPRDSIDKALLLELGYVQPAAQEESYAVRRIMKRIQDRYEGKICWPKQRKSWF